MTTMSVTPVKTEIENEVFSDVQSLGCRVVAGEHGEDSSLWPRFAWRVLFHLCNKDAESSQE